MVNGMAISLTLLCPNFFDTSLPKGRQYALFSGLDFGMTECNHMSCLRGSSISIAMIIIVTSSFRALCTSDVDCCYESIVTLRLRSARQFQRLFTDKACTQADNHSSVM